MIIEPKDYPNLPNAAPVDRRKWRTSDNWKHYWTLRQLTYDGAPIHGILDNRDNLPALKINRDGKGIYVILYTEMERSILEYLLTGMVVKYPRKLKDNTIPNDIYKGNDYIYRHLRRAVTRKGCEIDEEEKDGVKGLHIKVNYPYGSIDFGFRRTG